MAGPEPGRDVPGYRPAQGVAGRRTAASLEDTTLGPGYSGISIWEDRLYTMGDVGGGASYIVCLDAADGKLVWKTRVDKASGGPGPRCAPATDGKLVFGVSLYGKLACVEAATGQLRWRKD